MTVFFITLAGLLLVFIGILLIRALTFRPKAKPAVEIQPTVCDREKVVADLRDMLRCKTVSYRPTEAHLVKEEEFEKFRNLLEERFPLLHAACQKTRHGNTGILYHLPGRSCQNPSVLMAHYDVVPAEESDWEKPAFEGILEDDVIWGRGALDTKSTLCGICEALEALLAEGYIPQNDLYLSFSGDEEIDGDSCPAIVSYLEKKGIVPGMVLDEGGAVVEKVFPGVKEECALIGIGEKGSVNLNFTLHSKGGHASTPPMHTVLGRLSRAVTKIEGKPFRRQLTKPVRELFDTLGRHSTFIYRLIFANLWCFAPVVDRIAKGSGGEMNALLRTTVAVTRMQGSDAYNVLPPKASLGLNMRLLGEDTVESAKAYLEQVIKDQEIECQVVSGMNPSLYSDTCCESWQTLNTAIAQTWPKAIVSPYLMMACSDSRHYCRISDKVYRFSAMRLSKEERGMIHGNNERIPVDTLLTTVAFYQRLLRLL